MKIYYFFEHNVIKLEDILWEFSSADYKSLLNFITIYKRRTGNFISDDCEACLELPEGNLTPVIDSCHEALLSEQNVLAIKNITKLLEVLIKAQKSNKGIVFCSD